MNTILALKPVMSFRYLALRSDVATYRRRSSGATRPRYSYLTFPSFQKAM
ncbi:MAG: hypothetical protein AAB152_17670 [Candidatus Coatesbacteria bacterium]